MRTNEKLDKDRFSMTSAAKKLPYRKSRSGWLGLLLK
jgi:hypothetical protein